MLTNLDMFERIVRRAGSVTEAPIEASSGEHAFEIRNLHPKLPPKCRSLFDDGHYSEATFEALKYLDKTVQTLSGIEDTGRGLMMSAFGGKPPPVALNPLSNPTEINEQDGFKFIFSGVMSAIRNPKGHEYGINDHLDLCLEQLTLVSLLMRKLESVGHALP